MNLITINESSINNQETQTVNARELHEFLEVKSKFADWIKNRIGEYGFSEGSDYITLSKNLETGGRSLEYHLSLNMAKELSMVERNEKGRQARQYFINCEKIAKAKMPALPQTLSEALRLAADIQEEKERIAIERDHAVKTKAEIGSRREATAMATASAATRKAKQLQKELDQSQEYATVKRMEMIHHGIKFNWRNLKKASEDLGLPPIDVFDQNYGTVKGWHSRAWKKAYALGFERLEA